MIGSTLAPCPIFDPNEMTGDLRDEWDVSDFDERSRGWKNFRRSLASAVFHQLLHKGSGAAVTLPKTETKGTSS